RARREGELIDALEDAPSLAQEPQADPLDGERPRADLHGAARRRRPRLAALGLQVREPEPGRLVRDALARSELRFSVRTRHAAELTASRRDVATSRFRARRSPARACRRPRGRSRRASTLAPWS